MPDQTIVSGGSLDLSTPLTGGTNVDFVNSPSVSGILQIEPSAFENTTLTVSGTPVVETYLGGSIDNFQAGDTIVINSLAAAYAVFDHAPAGVTAAQNMAVSTALGLLVTAESVLGINEILTISSDGSITDNTGLIEGETLSIPFFGTTLHESLPAADIGYIDTYASSIEQALFGTGSPNSSLFINIGADAVITTDGSFAICYLRGTKIMTPAGEVAVETLNIGDPVITRFNGTQRIKWIGRQNFSRRFVENNSSKMPVRIAAGALGEGFPTRPLYVSGGHSMLIAGRLVLAKFLVNGINITQNDAPDEIHYYQMELTAHDCVLAEGAWSETYADAEGMRNEFHNAAEFPALYPDYVAPPEPLLCAARPMSGPALDEVLQPIMRLATAAVTPGNLRGWIDQIEPDGFVRGWAQDQANPLLPVLLELRLEDRVIRTFLACDYRGDLAEAGIGRGHCSFAFTVRGGFPAEQLHNLRICRAADGAELAMTPACQAALGYEERRRA